MQNQHYRILSNIRSKVQSLQQKINICAIIKMNKSNKKPLQKTVTHPTVFSVSIFQSAQQCIGIYLALQSELHEHRISAGRYLQKLLQRTKSPPIALTYTKQFLLLQSQSQIQLTIIRFISQLSDLSAGKSMQSSLSYVIENSSFLTELRHNLTHRVMVKGLVIERGKQIILKQLKDKYWKVLFEKIWETYHVDEGKVESIFMKISELVKFKEFQKSQFSSQTLMKSKIYPEYKRQLQNQHLNKLSSQYLFSKCTSNYQFKSLIHGYILKKVIPSIVNTQNSQNNNASQVQISADLVNEYFRLDAIQNYQSFCTRSVILFCNFLDIMLNLHKYHLNAAQYRKILAQTILKCLKQFLKAGQKFKSNGKCVNTESILFTSSIIIKKLRQLYLMKYVKQFNEIIKGLPEQVDLDIQTFWRRRQKQLGKSILISC